MLTYRMESGPRMIEQCQFHAMSRIQSQQHISFHCKYVSKQCDQHASNQFLGYTVGFQLYQVLCCRASPDELTFIVQIMIPGPPHMSLVIGWHRPGKREDASSTDVLSMDEEDFTDPFEVSLARYEMVHKHLQCFPYCENQICWSVRFIVSSVKASPVNNVVCAAKVFRRQ